MIILRQKIYSSCEDKAEKKHKLNKLGRKTDKDIREAVKGTKAEKKVDKILDKSTKEMKEAAQKEYAAISELGTVAKGSKEALEEARNLGYTKKEAIKAAKRILDRARDSQNSKEKGKKLFELLLERPERERMGFKKDIIRGTSPIEHFKEARTRIGFRPDYTEISGQPVRLGFKKFSKQDREVVPADIVKKVKDGGGVIQKDHNGDWRIISMKTKTNKSGKPEFWPQKSKDREDMVKILQSYHSNRH